MEYKGSEIEMVCPNCLGTGAEPDNKDQECTTCAGLGWVIEENGRCVKVC